MQPTVAGKLCQLEHNAAFFVRRQLPQAPFQAQKGEDENGRSTVAIASTHRKKRKMRTGRAYRAEDLSLLGCRREINKISKSKPIAADRQPALRVPRAYSNESHFSK
jgi:hypothetical protein